ncbi:hypothetical protein DL93DRAFT_1352445 [Clavulina sp. PMI_390]|nr:hypothetical protein DL93DRAFT_1352445 [Clavulina sp. PMI_390]
MSSPQSRSIEVPQELIDAVATWPHPAPPSIDEFVSTHAFIWGRSRGVSNTVGRPRNAWILYRVYFAAMEVTKAAKLQPQVISKVAGQHWERIKVQNSADHAQWLALAAKEKELHEVTHPGYTYRPAPRRSTKEKRIRGSSAVVNAAGGSFNSRHAESDMVCFEKSPQCITLADFYFSRTSLPEIAWPPLQLHLSHPRPSIFPAIRNSNPTFCCPLSRRPAPFLPCSRLSLTAKARC